MKDSTKNGETLNDCRHKGRAAGEQLAARNGCLSDFAHIPATTGRRWRTLLWAAARTPGLFFDSLGKLSARDKTGVNSAGAKSGREAETGSVQAFFYLRGLSEGLGKAAITRRQLWQNIPILAYHSVTRDPSRDPKLLLSLDRFERQMSCLAARGYHTITLTDFCAWQDHLVPLPRKPIILTFDDGYEGFCEETAPVLERHNFRATLFLIAGMIGRKVHWNGHPAYRIMGEQEVRALVAAGFDIQSHGVRHYDCRTVSPETVYQELEESALIIGEITGKPVLFFAYPHGGWTRAARDAVVAAGYAGACTTRWGRNDLLQDRYLLNRTFLLQDHSFWRLARELLR